MCFQINVMGFNTSIRVIAFTHSVEWMVSE